MRLKEGGRVVAVHQVSDQWAVHKDDQGKAAWASPVDVRVFVVESDGSGERDVAAYDLQIDHDGMLYDVQEDSNIVGVFRSTSEAEAIELGQKFLVTRGQP